MKRTIDYSLYLVTDRKVTDKRAAIFMKLSKKPSKRALLWSS